MQRLLSVLVLALLPISLFATSGTITTHGTTCSPSTNCLVVSMPQDKGGATLTLSGTWTGTIQFEATGDGGTTWVSVNCFPLSATSAVTSTTSNGTWQVNASGFTGLRMRSSATMTGSAVATITLSTAAARNNGGTNSGGGITNSASANVVMVSDGTNAIGGAISDNGTKVTITTEPLQLATVAFAGLPTPTAGMVIYCSDCQVTTAASCSTATPASCVCKASGSGAQAKYMNYQGAGAGWYCQ